MLEIQLSKGGKAVKFKTIADKASFINSTVILLNKKVKEVDKVRVSGRGTIVYHTEEGQVITTLLVEE